MKRHSPINFCKKPQPFSEISRALPFINLHLFKIFQDIHKFIHNQRKYSNANQKDKCHNDLLSGSLRQEVSVPHSAQCRQCIVRETYTLLRMSLMVSIFVNEAIIFVAIEGVIHVEHVNGLVAFPVDHHRHKDAPE